MRSDDEGIDAIALTAICVVCGEPFCGHDPGCCSTTCCGQADLELTGLVRSQRRLAAELVRGGAGLGRWIPSRRREQQAQRDRLDWARGRASLLTAAKLATTHDVGAAVTADAAVTGGAVGEPV